MDSSDELTRPFIWNLLSFFILNIQPPVALFNVASLTFNTLKLVEAVAQY